MDIFFDLYQQGQIDAAGASAARGERKADDARDIAQRVEERFDRLALINMALWSLLKEHTQLTDADLAARMQEIDLSDGVLDGKVRVTVTKCPECNRTLSKRHMRCLYCGYQVAPGDDVFGAVNG